MSPRRCDVAIVGGGLVGATLAAALRPLPLSVAVIDPGGGGGGSDARSLALSWGSARLYRTLGLWEGIGCAAEPIREIHVSRRGRLGFTRIRAGECGVDALGYVIPARLLDGRLDEALDSGTGTGPAAFERVRGTVEAVEAREGEALVSGFGPDGAIAVAARLVVGADGADSAVRRAAGLPLRVHRCDHVAFAGDFTPERSHRGRAFERFTERGPLAVLPLAEGRCGFVWTVPESIAAGEGFDGPGFGACLAEMFGSRVGELRDVELRVRLPLRVCHAPRVTAPRTVLVGNAANALHPVGAQGFNLGLRDVEVLARVLGEASAEGADAASVLARYAAARRVDHVLGRLLTGSLLRIYGSRAPLMPALGAAGLFALDRIGPAKRGFASLTMGAGWSLASGSGAGADSDSGAGAGGGEGAGAGLRRALRGGWRDAAGGAARAE